MFSCKIWEIFKNAFFYRIPPMAASNIGDNSKNKAGFNYSSNSNNNNNNNNNNITILIWL